MNINCTAFLAALVGLTSVALTMVGTIGCSTFEINLMNKGYTNSTTGQSITEEVYLQFSPYLYQTTLSANNKYSTECAILPAIVEYDRKWKSAMLLPIVSWVVAAINIIGLVCLMFCDGGQSTFPVIGFLFIFVNTTFNGLIFLILKSSTCNTITVLLSAVAGSKASGDLTCDVGPAFPFTVAGICGYFFAGLICLCGNALPKSSPSNSGGDNEQEHPITSPKPSTEEEQNHAADQA